ncbi:hypothetical protein PCASD_12400 [Puccinia coronata f. sp. avenae]|uniref:Uncharacterized protein n=1 Tax=Puccinia coronata f. sp. avenae TaxID=200324 RepID=A0A2N5U4S6_9BASI|nr:hypothetical protein PCASD_12400 [Puccinia coronata f. sp. avenae]
MQTGGGSRGSSTLTLPGLSVSVLPGGGGGATEQERMASAMGWLQEAGTEGLLEQLVKLLMALPAARDRKLCLFNPQVLATKDAGGRNQKSGGAGQASGGGDSGNDDDGGDQQERVSKRVVLCGGRLITVFESQNVLDDGRRPWLETDALNPVSNLNLRLLDASFPFTQADGMQS